MKVEQEHIDYEYWMLGKMTECIDKGWSSIWDSSILNNMWNIVGYVTAHNLINYLIVWKEIEIPDEIGNLLRKIDEQILSLSPNRTAVMEEKLQMLDMVKLKEFIDKHRDMLKKFE